MSKIMVPLGPQHPALEEPESFNLLLEGERVAASQVCIGYNHRGMEKAAEDRTYLQQPLSARAHLRHLLPLPFHLPSSTPSRRSPTSRCPSAVCTCARWLPSSSESTVTSCGSA